ncbi:MAG: hypothetical protein WCG80_11805 [Spirochaetales bacterium]
MRWFWQSEDNNALTENAAFITLAQIARENDSEASRIVRSLVERPTSERVLLVEKVARQFEAGGADAQLVQALRFLARDPVAERLRQLMNP